MSDLNSPMDMQGKQLAQRYEEILQEYFDAGGETALACGYEFARQALADGHGVLEMATLHHEVLRGLAKERRLSAPLMKKAGAFFLECLSPFEISHRGAREGARALRHMNDILELELQRIAHALHDEAGQMLASVHIALAELAREIPVHSHQRLRHVERLLKQIEGDLRSLSYELRPLALDNLGLAPALELLAERVAKRTGIEVSVEGEAGQRLPSTVETAIYRIAQEALNNAVKHAQAKSVRIELERSFSGIVCSVYDDGTGFDPRTDTAAPGMGLTGIRERLNALGGSLRVHSEPRRGTTIRADIPLPH